MHEPHRCPRPSPLVVVLALLVTGACLAAGGCAAGGGSGAGECSAASDCGATTSVCAGCPELAETLCAEGACVEREANEVDVSADVNLHRDIAADVGSFVHVLVAEAAADGPLTCDSAFSGGRVAEGANVLAAGYKAVEGGSFHEGVNVGRVPAGELLLLIVATRGNAGEGDVLATGCAGSLSASAPSLDAGLVQVAP